MKIPIFDNLVCDTVDDVAAPKPAHRAQKQPIFAEAHDYPEGQNPLTVFLAGFTDDSARTMRAALDSVADILTDGKIAADKLAWHELRSNHVTALRGRMLRYYAPATSRRYLSAVRGVLKEAWRLELIDRDTMERTVDVAPVRGRREQRGRAVSREELQAVFRTCAKDDNQAVGARDAAILALLYGSGLRRAELAGLAIDDIAWKDGSVRVLGKGNKQRTVFMPAGTVAAVRAWLEFRGTAAGPLMTQVGKTGQVRPHGITDQLVYHIVRKRHLEAGVEPFTPHDLRRSFISSLLDDGVDIATVARQVGHSNVQTTARYDRRDQKTQQRGVLRLDVPFGAS